MYINVYANKVIFNLNIGEAPGYTPYIDKVCSTVVIHPFRGWLDPLIPFL